MRLTTRLLLGLLPLACGAESNDSSTAAVAKDDDQSMVGMDINATQVDGVWVFANDADPGDRNDALLEGPAHLEGDCLFIRDAVVVWRSENMAEVRDLVASVKSGESPIVRVGGSGIGSEEGGMLPSPIVNRCETTEVWFE